MPHDAVKMIVDLQSAIAAIEHFTKGCEQEEFLSNPLLQAAVHMQFGIIGEALARLRKRFLEMFHGIRDGERIIAFRNIIAHGYDVIAEDLVWDVVQNHMPVLKRDLSRIQP